MPQGGTSGTFAFNPSLGELGLYAFNLIGVRNTSLTPAHMESLRMAANLLFGRWSGERGVNTWAVDLQQVPLVAGQATYSVPPNTVALLDAYVIGPSAQNRLILPISRSEYASYPNPNQIGTVTVFWFDRLLSPTITLYEVPDASQTQLNYYRMRQIQDAGLGNGQNVELPEYWLEAFALGLAHRLALIWAPDKAVGLKLLADEAYDIASTQNTETAAFYVAPNVQSYFRP